MFLKTWYLLLILLCSLTESKNIQNCRSNEKHCRSIQCIRNSYPCCSTNNNNKLFYRKENQKCCLNSECHNNILTMKRNYEAENDSLDNNNYYYLNNYNNDTYPFINKSNEEEDDTSFFNSFYFDIIFVVMVVSIIIMVIVVWFYSCGLKNDYKTKNRRRKEYLYHPSLQHSISSYDNYKKKKHVPKGRYMYDIYNDTSSDSFSSDYNIYRHHRCKSYTGSPKFHDKNKHRRYHSYNGHDLSDRREYEHMKKIKENRLSRMTAKDNYSVRGSYSQHHNHYNKNVEVTGSGDYTPPGFFEILWMTFSSVLDITTDIWYAESLFTNNVEIHYNNKWVFQVMSILTIAIPIVLNMSLSFGLISRRLKASFDFLNWYRTAPWAKKCTSFFVLFSAFNIELLSILVSGLWGLACFSAPIGIDDFWFRLKFWGFITTLVEDIPQFLIQFLILYPQIRSGKINTLVVIKLMIAAIVLIVDCISKGLIWYAMGSSISPPKKNKNIPFDEQATLGFPTSYSYTDNDPTIESSSYSRSDSDLYNHYHKNKYHKTHNNHINRKDKDDYSSSYDDNSVIIPKRKYYGVEETFADKIKEQPKYYHDLSYENDTIIDVIDSDEPSMICNNKPKNPNDKMMNKYKKISNSSYSDDTNSESYESYYLDSSHSRSVYTEINKDITESFSMQSQYPRPLTDDYHYYRPHQKERNSIGKKVGFEESIMVKENNKPSLYSKNVKIHREGLALPTIKMEKSPSFIPPSTYGNIYDFNEVSADVANFKRKNPDFYNNTTENNYRTSPRNNPTHISITANHNHHHHHHTSNNKNQDKGTIKNNNNHNNKRAHRNRRKYDEEESDISKGIRKYQEKNKNEEEIIYIDNIRYNNMFKL